MRHLGNLKGYLAAYIAYPIAERFEKRDVLSKVHELKSYYGLPFSRRLSLAKSKLIEIVKFAGEQVPYYRDLFAAQGFVPDKLSKDLRYLEDLPYLTRDIIREQGHRLLSRSLDGIRFYKCKTAGSTGPLCVIYIDQEAADYSSAVVRYGREQTGKMKHMSELHFATEFPDAFPLRDRLRERCKCFAMNRSNIFFDRLDSTALEKIWRALSHRHPYLVHGTPSILHTLACYVEHAHGGNKVFEIFESSGELLAPNMRETIARVFRCRVIDRYGLAEFGVVAYQLGPTPDRVQVLESEGWPELAPVEGTNSDQEFVFTGFRNRLMPLLRYRTGDLAHLEESPDGFVLVGLVGRIHDVVPIQGLPYSSQYIQDILDRVGGIQEFQIDVRFSPPVLRLVPEIGANQNEILTRLIGWWQDSFDIRFIKSDELVRVGHRSKFHHVVRE